MAEQTITINFAQGVNTKVDPFQVPVGQFDNLDNSVFTIGGRLTKRPGYGPLSLAPGSYLTTLNGNLLSIGTTINAYSSSLKTTISKGQLEPCSLSVLPLIHSNLNQVQCDSAISNGLCLTVFTETASGSSDYKYVIADAVNGQNIVAPSNLPVITSGTISDSSRVFVINNYFVVVSVVTVSGSKFIQYFTVPTTNPTNVSAAQNVTSQTYSKISGNPGWDATVTNNTLVVAYNTTSGGQGVHVASLTSTQIAANQPTSLIHTFTGATFIAALMSVCVDLTVNPNIVYINFWNNSTTNGYTAAVYLGFGTITTQFTPQLTISAVATSNLASAALNNSCTVFYEVTNNYSYDSSVPTHYINAIPVSSTGTVGTSFTSIMSVGLASKAFIVSGQIYYLSAYQSPFQPTYFLINGSLSTSGQPVIVAKLAYQNGGGYLVLGLPNVTVNSDVAQVPYLIVDLIEPITVLNTPQQTITGGVYAQTGINLVNFTIGTQTIDTAEIGQTLQISGGYLSMFDGYLPVEQNFFLFPDSIELTPSTSGGTITAQTYFYQVIYTWSDNQGFIHRSAPSIPVSTTTTGSTSSIVIHVPTLRLTAKTANPVKINIYRWSTANQIYQLINSVSSPLLNDLTVNSVSFTDTLPDSSYQGNEIIYTTGGVVADTNAPSTSIVTLFDTRLWLVDAEDPNVLWLSKQVIEGTPVEMSSLFTIYVAPNTGTVQSTGPMTALAPMDDKLIIFKKEEILYINGVGPNNLGTTSIGCSLGNYSQPTFITSTVGCTNQQSIVLTQDGLMFQSDKGIYLLSRNLQVSYIGAAVERFNSSLVNSANVIPTTTYVLFTLNTGQMLMYDYFYGQWGTFTGASTISSCIYNGLHTILTPFGSILQATPNQYLDNANPVLMQMTSGWLNLATLQGYERFYDFYLLATYLSPHKIQVQVAYDYNPSIQHSVLITPKNFSDSIPGPFGIATPFGSPGNKEQWRVHSKKQLTESFQLSLTEVFDPTLGIVAGAGFTLSGLTLRIDTIKGQRPQPGGTSVGLM